MQILAVRRTAAARQGLLVDLTTEAPEDELAAAQAELEAKEREEDAAQRAAALANKRKALEEAVVSQGFFCVHAEVTYSGHACNASVVMVPSCVHAMPAPIWLRSVCVFLWFVVVCVGWVRWGGEGEGGGRGTVRGNTGQQTQGRGCGE